MILDPHTPCVKRYYPVLYAEYGFASSRSHFSDCLPRDGYHYEIDVGQLPEFFKTLEQVLEEIT